MITVKTPYRISLFGGGTDFPEWFNNYSNGQVISATINKYCNISLRYLPPFFPHKYRIIWSKVETVNFIKKIKHPVINKVLEFYNEKEGLEISHLGDLPARSGIGSSSSFTVGLLAGLNFLQKNKISKNEIIKRSILVERKLLNESGGWQDQVITALGGLRYTSFKNKNKFFSKKINLSLSKLKKLEDSLILFYYGKPRTSSKIQVELKNNFSKKKKEFEKILKITERAKKVLYNNMELDEIGVLLDESWRIKKSLTDKISNRKVDEFYDFSKSKGAIGGKLLGAGGSGFMLFYVKKNNKKNFIKKISKYHLHIPFSFEDKGVHIQES